MSLTNRGVTRIVTVGWAGLTAPHAALVSATSSVPSRTTDVVSDLTEFVGTGYAGGFGGAGRAALAGLAVAEDDANFRAKLTMSAFSFAGVSAGRAAPIVAVIEEITNNAASNVIALLPWKATSNEVAITAATAANPPVLTAATAHGLVTGELVYIEGVAGGTWAAGVNGRFFAVTLVNATQFSLQGVDATAFGVATFATAKAYTPLTMNGATLTLTPSAEGAIRFNTAQAAETV